MQITIDVKKKIAISPQEEIVCGNSDYTIFFNFDAEWNEYPTKTARFVFNGVTREQIFEGNVCEVPVIQNATSCKVGVYAGDLHTTTPALVKCRKSILCDGGKPEEPDESIYNQLMELLNELKENGVSDEQITAAVEKYLEENPVEAGATEEQAAQIEQNRQDIADLKESGGTAGEDGEDGVSCTHEWKGTVLTVTSASGTSSADLKGEKGDDGSKGDTGVSITDAKINASGYLIVTLSNGETINAGLVSGGESTGGGSAGVGIESIRKTSTNGLIDTYTITLTDGNTSTFTVTNGKDGAAGAAGTNGKDGVSCTHSWNGTTLTITSASGTSSADLKGDKGETGASGANGSDGHTPEKGVDYFTEEDKQEIINAVKGEASEVEWFDLPHISSAVTRPSDVGAVYTKVNSLVSIQGSLKLINTLAKDASIYVATMPAGYRPKVGIATMRCLGGAWFRLTVGTDGKMQITNFQTSAMSNNYSFNVNIEYVAGN